MLGVLLFVALAARYCQLNKYLQARKNKIILWNLAAEE